jgi:hypothetical protein
MGSYMASLSVERLMQAFNRWVVMQKQVLSHGVDVRAPSEFPQTDKLEEVPSTVLWTK